MLQVVEAPLLRCMQLFNFTVAPFVVGSALFTVPTIRYLWNVGAGAEVRLSTFAAAQFVFASVLFLVGGMAIYWRKLERGRLEAFCHVRGLDAMFIGALQSEIRDKSHLISKQPRG